MDALALTDHGNMNGFPHAHQNALAMRKAGKNFKFLPGVEAYYHPDLAQWRRDHEAAQEARKEQKLKGLQGGGEEEETGAENEDASKDVKKWRDPVRRRHHLVLLPTSQKGLHNLFQLVSRSFKEGYYKFPRIDQRMLKEHGEDIVALTACLGGTVGYDVAGILNGSDSSALDDPALLDRSVREFSNTFDLLHDALPGRVYPEMQFNSLDLQHGVNRTVMEFCRRNGVTPVATADSHYPKPELWAAREIYKKLGRLKWDAIDPSLLPKDKSELKCELFPKNAGQMWESYQEYRGDRGWYDDEFVSRAIENSWHIAHDVIGDVQPDTSLKLPRFLVPEGFTPMGYLVDLCKEAIRERGLHLKPQYVQRLRTELEVIGKKDFALYFITMRSIIQIAKTQMLVGAGRGSGAGSLVNYLLGITAVDPLKYDLLFERFISPSRKELPDIDSDLADRDGLIQLMKKEYGEKNVYPIINFNTLQLKSLVKDLAKMYGIPFEEVNDATKNLDEEVRHKAMPEGENKSLFMLKYDDCVQYSQAFREFTERHPHLAEHVKVLYRQPRSYGKHAGGVIVTQDADRAMPLFMTQGEMRTPWAEGMNRKDLEIYGLVKVDLLGLETLRIIEACIRRILEKEGNPDPTWAQVQAWYDDHLHPAKLDFDDQNVYREIFHRRRFAGTFQFTAKHTQQFIQKFHPVNLRDLAIATSIYRPGPLAADVDKLYIDKKRAAEAGERFTYVHPAVEKVLGPTFGYPIFQEQLMQLAAELSGFNPDECDKLRKTILKRSVQSQAGQKGEIQKLEDKFLDGAEANGLERGKALKLFEDLAAFASYGFNASHAYSYSMCTFQSAWLLHYYEAEWLCSYAETMIGDPESRQVMMSEVKSFGWKIGKVDVNLSSGRWRADPASRTLIPSFKTVKGVGDSAIEEMMGERPYTDLADFLWRPDGSWRHSKTNKRVVESLVKVGAMDSLGAVGPDGLFRNYRQLFTALVEHWDELKKRTGMGRLVELIGELESEPDWTGAEKIAMQQELIGDVQSDTLISPDLLARLDAKSVPSIDGLEVGEKRVCWLTLTGVELKQTKAGKGYLVLQAMGESATAKRVMCWGFRAESLPALGRVYLAEVERDDRGYSCQAWKVKTVG